MGIFDSRTEFGDSHSSEASQNFLVFPWSKSAQEPGSAEDCGAAENVSRKGQQLFLQGLCNSTSPPAASLSDLRSPLEFFRKRKPCLLSLESFNSCELCY